MIEDTIRRLASGGTQDPLLAEKTGTWPETNHDNGIYCKSGTGQVAKIEDRGDVAFSMPAHHVTYREYL